MNPLIFICICITSIIITICIIDKIEDAKQKRNFMKWERKSAVKNNYRTHITCNDVIAVKTFKGDSYSEILEKAIDYSLEEMNGFPNVIILKKNIIYL